MSLSDCIHCWETPCICGWNYRNYTISALQKQIDMFEKVKKFKEENPTLKFSSSDYAPTTKGDELLLNILNKK